jgi:hypothetical protein
MYTEANERDKEYAAKEKGDLITDHRHIQEVIKRPEARKYQCTIQFSQALARDA